MMMDIDKSNLCVPYKGCSDNHTYSSLLYLQTNALLVSPRRLRLRFSSWYKDKERHVSDLLKIKKSQKTANNELTSPNCRELPRSDITNSIANAHPSPSFLTKSDYVSFWEGG